MSQQNHAPVVCVTGSCGVFVCRQQGLFRVLKAFTQYQPEEGYCQAQGPVAAVLLMNMPAEVAINSTVDRSAQQTSCRRIFKTGH